MGGLATPAMWGLATTPTLWGLATTPALWGLATTPTPWGLATMPTRTTRVVNDEQISGKPVNFLTTGKRT